MTNLGIEKNRFNESAKNALDGNNLFSVNDLTLPLKTPYFFYQSMINEYANSGNLILHVTGIDKFFDRLFIMDNIILLFSISSNRNACISI